MIDDEASRQQAQQEWLRQGDNFVSQKRYQEALLAYEQAVRLDPQDALVYKNKGVVLGERADMQKLLRPSNRGYALSLMMLRCITTEG